MPFVGTPVVKQTSDRSVKITGVQLNGEGTIGLSGNSAADIQLPAGFKPRPEGIPYGTSSPVTLADGILVTINNVDNESPDYLGIFITYSNPTNPATFLINLESGDEDPSNGLEITVQWLS